MWKNLDFCVEKVDSKKVVISISPQKFFWEENRVFKFVLFLEKSSSKTTETSTARLFCAASHQILAL